MSFDFVSPLIEMNGDARISYVSCACNQVPHSADWGINGLICYAANHAVAIYDPYFAKIGRVIQTLHRHKDRINNVRWIKLRNEKESELLSCSADGTAIVWSKTRDKFECSSIINVGEVLTFANSLYLLNKTSVSKVKFNFTPLLICTGAVNGELKLWLRSSLGDVNCIQTLTFGRKLPIEACLSYLPKTEIPILSIALEDWSILLFVKDTLDTGELCFNKVQVLTGHTDWVRCMDMRYDNDNNIILASGSQDAMIRLWKISMSNTEFPELYQSKQTFIANNIEYNIHLQSVLYGHEGWVYGVHWCPMQSNNESEQQMKLLSCSLDKSMIIWELVPSTGMWIEKVRVGEVGGNSLGLYGCKFSEDGLNIMAHGFQGSFHIWNYSKDINAWVPRPVPSGHFGQVVDLCWDQNGRFLMTASTDQTTRIHAPWEDQGEEQWHEIARPQVHGYDMACLSMLSSYMFASGAEEKVVRVFTAPAIFKNHLRKIANVDDFEYVTADSATVPALGLTNKATFDNIIKTDASDIDLKNMDYTPLTEEELIQKTLWPELKKLYGHGYEIFSMAAAHNGTLLASACRSSSSEHAAILLWNTETWTHVQKLISHQLTVTQMEFSPDDNYLLSVSRDRRWSLFEYRDGIYTLAAASSKKDSLHSRIIWCCAWTHDSHFFATGSRDGKIGIWNPHFEDKNIVPATNLDTNNLSVTALCFVPSAIIENSYILAIGYEIGHIEIQKLKICVDSFVWQKYITYDTSEAHHLTVRRLKFRPKKVDSTKVRLQLASCGSDHTVKIYDLDITELQDL